MKNKSVIFFFIVILLTSCVQLTLTKIAQLKKGFSIEESYEITGIQPKYTFLIDDLGILEKIEVHVYNLSSGDYSSNYLLVFKDNKLFYWGYPHEFAREKSSLLNEIGSKSVKNINQLSKTQLRN